MFSSISRKLIVAFASVLALMLIAGLGTALAAQHHGGAAAPFAVSGAPLVVDATPAAMTKQQHLIGTIQSINQAKKTFTLLVTGQTRAITIAFDARTNTHTGQLTVKAHVLVESTARSDGSLYATEIEPAAMAGHRGDMHAGSHGTCSGTMSGTRH